MANPLQFGPFLLDPDVRALFKDRERLLITSKEFDVLLMLIQDRARVVTKQDLLAKLWPGMTVEEANITQHVYTLRKLLGDDARQHRYIATISGHGYRFVGSVTELPPGQGRGEVGQAPAGLIPAGPFGLPLVFRTPTASFLRGRRIALLVLLAICAIAVLAPIWWRSRPPRLGLPELEQRQITFNSSENAVLSGAISTDGKYLAYADWTGLHVKNIEIGTIQNLAGSQDTGAQPVSWSVGGWLGDSHTFTASLLRGESAAALWLAAPSDGRLLKLQEDAIGWSNSSDGTAIVFTKSNLVVERHAMGGREIWAYNLRTGQSLRLVVAHEGMRYSDAKWTPDGKSLAFISGGKAPGTLDRAIEVCDSRGYGCHTAVTGLNIRSFVVLNDGRLIVSKAEPEPNGLSCNLWITTTEGQELHRLTNWQGSCLDSLTLTSDSSALALRKLSFVGTTYIAELLQNGTQISPPARFNYNKGEEGPQAWLPDSRTLLLASNQKGHWEILRQILGNPSAPPLVSEARSTGHPSVTPDGKWILYMVGPRSLDATLYKGPVTLMRVPITGGTPAEVAELRGSDIVQCSRNGGHACVLIRKSGNGSCITFTSLDPLSGIGAAMASYPIEFGSDYGFALSAGGTRMAIAHAGNPRIDLLSLDTGAVEHVPATSPHDEAPIAWMPHDSGFFVPAETPDGIALLEIDLSGSAHIVWDQKGATRMWGIPSPDGRLLAMLNWTVDSNMWTIRGF